jgi:hypothetical protein
MIPHDSGRVFRWPIPVMLPKSHVRFMHTTAVLVNWILRESCQRRSCITALLTPDEIQTCRFYVPCVPLVRKYLRFPSGTIGRGRRRDFSAPLTSSHGKSARTPLTAVLRYALATNPANTVAGMRTSCVICCIYCRSSTHSRRTLCIPAELEALSGTANPELLVMRVASI